MLDWRGHFSHKAQRRVRIILHQRNLILVGKLGGSLAFFWGDTHTEWVVKIRDENCQLWTRLLSKGRFQRVNVHACGQIAWDKAERCAMPSGCLHYTHIGDFLDYCRVTEVHKQTG